MRQLRFLLTLTLVGASLTPIHAETQALANVKHRGKTIKAVPNQVLVKFKPGRALSGQSMLSGQHQVKSMGTNESIGYHKIPVPKGYTVESFVKKLNRDPNVEYAEPNGLVRAFVAAPNDPEFSNQYHLQSGAGGTNILSAWDITTGSVTTIVAVLDSGIITAHTDLDDNLWVNPSPSGLAGLNGTRTEIDWGSGCTEPTDGGVCNVDNGLRGPGQCASNDPEADDNPCWHGTFVSGIVAAETGNGINGSGVCQNCKIMSVKVLNSAGAGNFSSIADGITFAMNNGAHVINMSLGSSNGLPGSSVVTDAVALAIQNNIIVVAASGNFGAPCAVAFPASISDVIAVGAIDSNDLLASFSCGDNNLDVVAAGVNVRSTTSGGTTTGSGTSFAAPIVAGIAGLIRSINPTMTVANVSQIIKLTATDLGASGFDTSFGFGRADAFRALTFTQTNTLPVSNPADPDETFPFPNPFNPTTGSSVNISLPESLGSQGIKIEIMKISGERIRTLTGTTLWDGKNDSGDFVASGLYFYFVETSAGNAKGKISIVR